MSDEKLIDATTSIVREYLQKNTVALEDLPRLMQAVREGLMGGTSISMPPAPVASSPVETVVEVSAPEKPVIEQVLRNRNRQVCDAWWHLLPGRRGSQVIPCPLSGNQIQSVAGRISEEVGTS
ncbi:hypothetical protein RI056_18525 (plasmid) [Komagataeibacter nataicola]|uniref:hypothetical protein n=1 Tax=Komagataeibacter nataicola TaxID=265960 RepID=UPI0028AEDBC8|nr:hypothetical protein [Komagataeibacter nataicola]WNM10296.1 hypothetical protein RI056_18525 [Komagataeibacter nataicola]